MEPLQISKSFMRESQTQFPKDKSLLSLYISKAFVLAFDPASSFFVFRFFFFFLNKFNLISDTGKTNLKAI